jgi:hypothetical protein
LLLHTSDGRVFVKGLHTDRHPGAVTQRREAAIAPYVGEVSPRLLWQTEIDGWVLLGFEYIEGRHADYAPGSDDLPEVIEVITRLGSVRCPDLPELKKPEQRWAAYVSEPEQLELLRGNVLLHTDYNPLNILIDSDGRAHIIDWAWPTRGAAWIDPACFVYRLMAAGHTPRSAEAWARYTPAWAGASEAAISVFSRANARLWAEIAQDDPDPWKQQMATITHEWAASR